MKKKILTVAQILLAVGLVYYFANDMKQRGDLERFLACLKDAAGNWAMLAAGISLFLVSIMLCTWRWSLLLEAVGVKLRYSQTLTLYFIGQFFSSFLPGATSGDIFKAVYISREAPQKKTEVVATVFIDRIIGLATMLILAVTIMMIRLNFFMAHNETKIALLLFLGALLATVAGIAMVFGQNLLDKIAFFRRVCTTTALGGILAKAYESFHLCLTHPGVLLKTLLISLVNHLTFIMCAVFLGTAIGIKIKILEYLTVFPVINTVASLPITPSGMGTRDAACKLLLGIFDVPAPLALALSLMLLCTVLFWSLVGGVVYIAYTYRTGKAAKATSTGNT